MTEYEKYVRKIPRSVGKILSCSELRNSVDQIYGNGDVIKNSYSFLHKDEESLECMLEGILHLSVLVCNNENQSLIYKGRFIGDDKIEWFPSYIYIDDNDHADSIFTKLEIIENRIGKIVSERCMSQGSTLEVTENWNYLLLGKNAVNYDFNNSCIVTSKNSNSEDIVVLSINKIGFLEIFSELINIIKKNRKYLSGLSLKNIKDRHNYRKRELPPKKIINGVLRAIKNALNLDYEIDIDDDYFELGGTSLRSFLVIREIAKELEIDISVRQLYENSKIIDLCIELNDQIC